MVAEKLGLIAVGGSSRSYAQTISKLGLVPAGGNYDQVKRRVLELQLDTTR